MSNIIGPATCRRGSQRAWAVGAPAARFEKACHAQIEDKEGTWIRRAIEAIGQLLGRRCGGRDARQLVQPVADRAVERVALDRPKRRRVFQCLEQHRRAVLAIMPDRATALRRQFDRVVAADLDKDMIGPRPGPLDRGDQPPPALVGMQVADRAASLIRPRLADLARKASVDILLIERKPRHRRKPGAERRIIVQGSYPLW
jgi:hypothetical protein